MQAKELELYIHLPFCVRKCLYCDFLSGPGYDQDRYLDALIRELERYREKAADFKLRSIFFGGGTPTLLTIPQWERLMSAVKEFFVLEDDCEITSEGNPGTIDPEKLACLREIGINRLSLGLQSANNKELALLGRIHTFEDFLTTYEDARAAGFGNINVDLMSGLPGQALTDWLTTLSAVAELGPEHISAYSLIIEEGTEFGKRYANGIGLPDEDVEREMYHKTKEVLAGYGFTRYEISNYAKPGFESRHNLGYWTGVPYLGCGLGAASLFGGFRYQNPENMEQYLKEAGSDALIKDKEIWDQKTQMEERMFLGLRTMLGVEKMAFLRDFGASIESIYGDVTCKYKGLGLLRETDTHLQLTDAGIDVSNVILADFLL
ncbi:MAG: oxygen-independent coproporphyrinogen III oxidase [Lachnospiraceae bacterium]|nr:oxygen-independent coproporphyrinogen III oxidase [Lachnospiraceae bacterium]